MTRETYLKELKHALGGLPEHEKREIASDYEEHFRAGAAGGKSDEEIAKSLGNPRIIGKSYRIDAMLDDPGKRSAVSVLRAVFATLSLGFFNVVIVLGPFAGAVGVMIGLWAAAASIALSGLGLVLGVIAEPIFPQYITTGGFSPVFVAFAGIALAALGALASIGMWKLTTWVVGLVGKYVQMNVRIVTNRR